MKKIFAALFTLMLLGLTVKATDLQFNLRDPQFGLNSVTNVPVQLQAQNIQQSGAVTLLPWRLTQTTDTNGVTTFTNIYGSAVSGFYHYTISVPNTTKRVEGNVWIQSTNLGTVSASTVDLTVGAPTYPAGTWSWSAYASDQRYAGGSNLLSSYVLIGQLNNASNVLQQQIYASTNGFLLIATNIANGVYSNNPAGYLAQIPVAATNQFLVTIPTAATNKFITGLAATNAFDPTNSASIAYTSILSSNYVTRVITNGYAGTNWVNTYFYPTSNPSSFVTAAITNGLATTNYVQALTNGFVSSGITNGYAGTNWVNTYFYPTSNPSSFVTAAITNGLATTNYVQALTNGLVSSSITNGVVFTNLLTSASNALVNAIISATNQLASTNFVNNATNILASTNWVISQSYLKTIPAAATNQFATTNYAYSAGFQAAKDGGMVTNNNSYAVTLKNKDLYVGSGVAGTNHTVVYMSDEALDGTYRNVLDFYDDVLAFGLATAFSSSTFNGQTIFNDNVVFSGSTYIAGTPSINGLNFTNIQGSGIVGLPATNQIAVRNAVNTFSSSNNFTGGLYVNGTAVLTNIAVYQPASANLTNWSNLSTNQHVGTNDLVWFVPRSIGVTNFGNMKDFDQSGMSAFGFYSGNTNFAATRGLSLIASSDTNRFSFWTPTQFAVYGVNNSNGVGSLSVGDYATMQVNNSGVAGSVQPRLTLKGDGSMFRIVKSDNVTILVQIDTNGVQDSYGYIPASTNIQTKTGLSSQFVLTSGGIGTNLVVKYSLITNSLTANSTNIYGVVSNAYTLDSTNLNIRGGDIFMGSNYTTAVSSRIVFPNGDVIAEFTTGLHSGGETGISIGISNGVPLYEQFSFLAGAFNDIAAADGVRMWGGSIPGGVGNIIGYNGATSRGNAGFIAGGSNNIVNGTFGFAAGARSIASDNGSFALGYNTAAQYPGSFVWSGWAGYGASQFADTGTNQFLIKAVGGVGINTNNPTGYSLNIGGIGNAVDWYKNGVGVLTSNSVIRAHLATNVVSGIRITNSIITDSSLTNPVIVNPTIVSALTTNIALKFGDGTTNTLYFTNGILYRITP